MRFRHQMLGTTSYFTGGGLPRTSQPEMAPHIHSLTLARWRCLPDSGPHAHSSRKRPAKSPQEHRKKKRHNTSREPPQAPTMGQEHSAVPHNAFANRLTIPHASRELHKTPEAKLSLFFTLHTVCRSECSAFSFYHVLEMLLGTAVLVNCALTSIDEPLDHASLQVFEIRFDCGSHSAALHMHIALCIPTTTLELRAKLLHKNDVAVPSSEPHCVDQALRPQHQEK